MGRRHWSQAARERRHQRAVDRGYLQLRPLPGHRFLQVPSEVKAPLQVMAESLCYHVDHDRCVGATHHHGRLASTAAHRQGHISAEEHRQAMRSHRNAGRAKHNVSMTASSGSDPLFGEGDPWARYRQRELHTTEGRQNDAASCGESQVCLFIGTLSDSLRFAQSMGFGKQLLSPQQPCHSSGREEHMSARTPTHPGGMRHGVRSIGQEALLRVDRGKVDSGTAGGATTCTYAEPASRWVALTERAMRVNRHKQVSDSTRAMAKIEAFDLSGATWEPLVEPSVGMIVRSSRQFHSNNVQYQVRVGACELGVISHIDEDGDIQVFFEGLDAQQWILQSNFGCLEKPAATGSQIRPTHSATVMVRDTG